LLKVYKLF